MLLGRHAAAAPLRRSLALDSALVTDLTQQTQQTLERARSHWQQFDPQLSLFYWIEKGCGRALVGPLPRETRLALVEAIYKQHPATTPLKPPPAASAPRF